LFSSSWLINWEISGLADCRLAIFSPNEAGAALENGAVGCGNLISGVVGLVIKVCELF
jgi:hypothetical protein